MHTNTTQRRILATAGGAIALCGLAFGAVGCSTSDNATGSSSSAASSASTHNDADVTFNSMMIPHHQQAVEMAELVNGRTTNPQLIALATRIKNAQQPEIDQMTARLTSWGVETSTDEHSTDEHSGHGDMSGMMSEADMAALRAASGAEFDTRWINMMIQHHMGAIAMADTEIAEGSDPASKALAAQIKSTQQAEIDEMGRIGG
ncbi:DUF305 domain-containing protein [Gordonia bronchialis]|uniref:DUF305 domain-containing protein n=1 Tax=Gordonia bronchialis TaxID=2054 RepID=UPI002431D7EE|nr:DUF305 domain-containing protein [Gordonia bronchialis]